MLVEQPEPPTNLRLRLRRFTLSDIEGFCHDLEINFELLRHQKLDDFILDLLGYCQRRPGYMEHLTQLVEQAEAERAIPPAEGECPYKGLQAYEEADAHLFFGREKLTQELVEHLQKHTFLAVVGASGSGKSSVVKAGVIPHLRKDNQWLIVPPFRPGANPFEQLALHLLPFIDPNLTPTGRLIEQTKLSQAFVEGTLPLSKVVYQILQNNPGRGRLLLSVDQFEELFTHHQDKQSQEQWLAFMTEPLHQPHNQLTLLLTLRGDFYNSAIQYLPLKPWLETSQKIVTALTPAELEEAITRPAAQAWQFQDGLVATILEDVAQEPGILPFLSQALLKTWEARQGRQLTLAGYLTSGGVKEAISQTAEQVYNQLSPPAQEVVRGVLLRLTQLGEGREDTRRRLTRPELAGLPYPPELVQEVLDKLTAPQVRLLTQDQEVLEVAHEALIRGWPLLRQWLDEDREGLRLHRQLTEAAGEWERIGRDKSVLWRGVRLAQVQEWLTAKRDLTLQERAFLEESTSEEKRVIQEKESQLQRIRIALVGALVLALVAFLTAGLATYFYKQANDQANIALSVALASASETVGNTNVMKSFLLGLEAFQTSPTNLAFAALNKQLPYVTKPLLTLQHEESVNLALWNGDESYFLTTNVNDVAKVWSRQSGELLLTLPHDGSITSTLNIPDNQYVLTFDKEMDVIEGDITVFLGWREREVRVWDSQTGELRFILPHKGSIYLAEWILNNYYILTISSDGLINVWDSQPKELPFTIPNENGIRFFEWSADNTLILTIDEKDTVMRWDKETEKLSNITPSGDKVPLPKWSFDNRYFLTYSGKTAQIWDGQTEKRLYSLSHTGTENKASVWLDYSGIISFAEWSPDNLSILTISEEGTANLWDSKTGRLTHTLLHETSIQSVKWSSDSLLIMVIGSGGTVKVWNRQSGLLLLTIQHDAGVNSARWNPNETQIFTTDYEGVARLWDAKTGGLLLTIEGDGSGIVSAEWSETDSRIWIVTENGLVRSYYTDPEELIAEACSRATRNLTWEEWQTYLPGRPYRQTCPNLPVHESVPENERP